MFKELLSQRLSALFVWGWLLLNFPLLALWDVDATWRGVPVFPAALFVLWAVVIAMIAWLVERPTTAAKDD
ncbi:MAG: hypothetical protein AUJ20_14525 [Comamonadaceae bacterium CG1_02_60_18]|nr:MAG: hypothetical protein AUJ20_14525 [Comamonadaceae bacterium CG1_02_60_18]PIQ55115.1 MAG: hypothetical protein COW02_03710 [Comamonadaceae bacterium CG12_big_fil_rev_8_21_14_0_65_59_15]